MIGTKVLNRVVGSSPVRAAVNRGFHLYARQRTHHLARLDPVTTQQDVLCRLVSTLR